MDETGILANPFTPIFGQVPANMAGRDRLLREMATAFNAQARAPELTMLLSDGDVAFLKAMLPDDVQSLMWDVAARMGKSISYAGMYRECLLRQGVIGEPDRNAVGFELPGFRGYFAERIGWDG